jgi:nicotinate-nucleotide adenylyltransferase
MARIGLLGGSFNPAHRGHRHISLEAMRVLGLDEVWWLVSPGNPLKEGAKDMAPFDARLATSSNRKGHATRSTPSANSSSATRSTASSGCLEATLCQIFTAGVTGGDWPEKSRLR